jgi:hypothetical protein
MSFTFDSGLATSVGMTFIFKPSVYFELTTALQMEELCDCPFVRQNEHDASPC